MNYIINSSNVRYSRCPLLGELREKWLRAIKSHQSMSPDDEKSLSFMVCSEHFEPSQFYEGKLRLRPGGNPTIFPTYSGFELGTENLTLNDTNSDASTSSITINPCDK